MVNIDGERHLSPASVNAEWIRAYRIARENYPAQFLPHRAIAAFMRRRSIVGRRWLMRGAPCTRLHQLRAPRRRAGMGRSRRHDYHVTFRSTMNPRPALNRHATNRTMISPLSLHSMRTASGWVAENPLMNFAQSSTITNRIMPMPNTSASVLFNAFSNAGLIRSMFPSLSSTISRSDSISKNVAPTS